MESFKGAIQANVELERALKDDHYVRLIVTPLIKLELKFNIVQIVKRSSGVKFLGYFLATTVASNGFHGIIRVKSRGGQSN